MGSSISLPGEQRYIVAMIQARCTWSGSEQTCTREDDGMNHQQNRAAVVAIDVGNTHVHIGIDLGEGRDWDQMLRFDSDPRRTADEWNVLLEASLNPFEADLTSGTIGLASVVPGVTRNLTEYFEQHLGQRIVTVSPDLDLGITVGTDQPYETGQDRIANAVAGFDPGAGAVIVIDMGTATKVDSSMPMACFEVERLHPASGSPLETLAGRTARLYSVPLNAPESAIGPNTTAAIQAGVVLGHLAMIEGLVNHQKKEIGTISSVVLTGGYANVIAATPPANASHLPNLTLDGVRKIALRNQNQ